MDTTIRNLDAHAYRALRAQAAKEGRPVGVLISEAIRSYLAPNRKFKSIFDFPSEDFGPGTEHLSEQVDQIVYGVDR